MLKVASMRNYKKVLFITSQFPCSQTYGGPLAVIKIFNDKLNSKSNVYRWQSMTIFGQNPTEERKSSPLLRITKEIIGQITRSNSFFQYALAFIFAVRYLNKLFKHIIGFSQNLEKNYEKICVADVIHCHDIYAMIALLNVVDKKLPETLKPILLEIHSEGATSEEIFRSLPEQKLTIYGYYLKQYEAYAISRSRYLIVPSRGAKRQLLQHIPKLKSLNKKIRTIYNGIEKIAIIPKKKARAMLGLCKNNIVIISVGRLNYDKGFDVLIKAVKTVIDKGFKNIRLLIAGDGPVRKPLEKMIRNFKLESYVKLLGYIPHDKINVLYSAADIYVSSSRRAAFDLSLLEALSVGLPIIATNTGGNFEIIDNAGVLVEPDDPKMLSRNLLHLIVDKHYREKLSLNAYTRFKKNFDIETVINSYVQFLNALTK